MTRRRRSAAPSTVPEFDELVDAIVSLDKGREQLEGRISYGAAQPTFSLVLQLDGVLYRVRAAPLTEHQVRIRQPGGSMYTPSVPRVKTDGET